MLFLDICDMIQSRPSVLSLSNYERHLYKSLVCAAGYSRLTLKTSVNPSVHGASCRATHIVRCVADPLQRIRWSKFRQTTSLSRMRQTRTRISRGIPPARSFSLTVVILVIFNVNLSAGLKTLLKSLYTD